MSELRLAPRQWDVLHALAILDRDASEIQVRRALQKRGRFPAFGSLHQALRRLRERGTVDRYGAAGTYTYEINAAGRAALESFR